MKTCVALLLVSALALASCQSEPGPAVLVSDVRILAPLPGTKMGVAYLKIQNRGEDAVVVQRVTSPQFKQVELHETIIEDDVSRMRPLGAVRVAAKSEVAFEAGGKHLMLIGPGPDALPGSPVTLEIHHDNGLLIVSATMQTRLPVQ